MNLQTEDSIHQNTGQTGVKRNKSLIIVEHVILYAKSQTTNIKGVEKTLTFHILSWLERIGS